MNSSGLRKIALVVSFLSLGASAFSVSKLRSLLTEEIVEAAPQVSRKVASVESHGANKSDSKESEKGKSAEHGKTNEHEKPSGPAATEVSLPTSIFGLEEILVNISEGAAKSNRGVIHTLGLKIDLELFSDDLRSSIERNQPALRNTIIEVANMQELEKLNTLAGKLYFKELLVSKMNAQLKQVAVRDLHFSTFFLK